MVCGVCVLFASGSHGTHSMLPALKNMEKTLSTSRPPNFPVNVTLPPSLTSIKNPPAFSTNCIVAMGYRPYMYWRREARHASRSRL